MLRQFSAILRDSVREAVDGFVIYVMLVLSGVLVLLVASLSFTPVSADRVLSSGPGKNSLKVLNTFTLYIPDRGRSSAVASALGVDYEATDVKQDGRDVSFRLTAKGSKDDGTDGFRKTVAGWLKPAGPTKKFKLPIGGKKGGNDQGIEFSPQEATKDEAQAVTPDDMAAFVADQLRTHVGIAGAVVRPAAGPAPDRTYPFDVSAPGATAASGWPQEVGLFYGGVTLGELPLGLVLFVVEDQIVNGVGAAVLLLIGVIITAFFIPNMIRKGAFDLLTAKPIGRARLLLFKYVGGLTFVFLVIGLTVGGVWLVLGVRSGHWDPRFLLVVPAVTFTFALLYAVSALVAVFTRSPIAAILVTLTLAAGLYVLGKTKDIADLNRGAEKPILGEWPGWVYAGIDGLNNGLPRYKDLDKVTSKVVGDSTRTPIDLRVESAVQPPPSLPGVVGQTLAYIAGMLGIASWRLVTRDG